MESTHLYCGNSVILGVDSFKVVCFAFQKEKVAFQFAFLVLALCVIIMMTIPWALILGLKIKLNWCSEEAFPSHDFQTLGALDSIGF